MLCECGVEFEPTKMIVKAYIPDYGIELVGSELTTICRECVGIKAKHFRVEQEPEHEPH